MRILKAFVSHAMKPVKPARDQTKEVVSPAHLDMSELLIWISVCSNALKVIMKIMPIKHVYRVNQTAPAAKIDQTTVQAVIITFCYIRINVWHPVRKIPTKQTITGE
ncbi:unnamed protein product, partial [Callosobruchus maculatus]